MQTAGCSGHHVVESSVEAEVVSVGSVEVVPGQGRITLELVVGVETWLRTKAWGRCARSGVAAERELASDRVAIETDAQHSKQDCQVITHTVDVLLSVGEFGEGGDAVAGDCVRSQQESLPTRQIVDRITYGSRGWQRCSLFHVVSIRCNDGATQDYSLQPGHGPRISRGPGAWYACAVSPWKDRQH